MSRSARLRGNESGTLRSLHQFVERTPHSYAVRVYYRSVGHIPTRTPQGKDYQLLNFPYFLADQVPAYLDYFDLGGKSLID